MKNFNSFQLRGLIERENMILLFCFYVTISVLLQIKLSAQGCDKIVFSAKNTSQCCYNLTAQNMTDNCFQQLNLSFTDGVFTSYVSAPGWQTVQVSPKEYNVRPSIGFIPFGNVNIGNFCVSGTLNQNLTILWDNLCLLEACEAQLPVTACPPDNVIRGLKYVDIGCAGKLYKDQPVLGNWPIELYDEFGQLIANVQTDDKGNFSFTDLDAGTYTCREGAQTGWKSSVPKSGQHVVTLSGTKDTSIVNFGNCPTTCHCDSIYVYATQVENTNPDTGFYYLSVSNVEGYCFEFIEVKVDSGELVGWDIQLPGWKANLLGPNLLRLFPTGTIIPEGGYIPLRLSIRGGVIHKITSKTYYDAGMKVEECKSTQVFPFPIIIRPRSCCPTNTFQGPELLTNGDFTNGCTGFNYDAVYTGCGSTVVNGPGKLNVTDGINIGNHNGYFSTIGKSGSLTDKFLIVDASLTPAFGSVVWEQLAPITLGNFDYAFCAYFKNIIRPGSNLSNPIVVIDIVNNITGNVVRTSPATTLSEGLPWQLISINWSVIPVLGTTYKLRVRAVSTVHQGNDFAVDCISFKTCNFKATECSCPGDGNSRFNLVTNGDFSSGNSGFISNLNWDNGLINGCGQGTYGVHNNLGLFCSGWPTSPMAISPPLMLCIDGRDNGATPTVLWSSVVTLDPNSKYCFSFQWQPAFDASIQSIPIDILLVDVAGNPVPLIPPITNLDNLSGNAGTWYQKSYTWAPGLSAANQYLLAIRQTSGDAFRDFGIDNICMTKISDCCDTCNNNLVQNPGFLGAVPGNIPPIPWTTSSGSPDMGSGQGSCDQGYVQMWGHQTAGESICQPFTFINGHTYSIKFCAEFYDVTTWPNIQFEFMAAANCSDPWAVTPATIGMSPLITNQTWLPFTLSNWLCTSTTYNTLIIRAISNQITETPFGHIDNICIEDITDSCVCGPYEFTYGINRIGPLLIKNCGDTLYVPSSKTDSLLNFGSKFSCIGANCNATIDWKLTGPLGSPFNPVLGVQVAPGSIAFTNASFPYPGIYTLTVTGYCNGIPCPPCTIYFNSKGYDCCKNREDFCMAAMNAVSITVDNNLCKATLNIGNLPPCIRITDINWGELPGSAGPYGANTMPMHTYSGSGTYYLSYLAEEWDNSTMPERLCSEKLFTDTITLRCDTCACRLFSPISFVNPNWINPVVTVGCGSRIVLLPCMKPGQTLYFHGDMLCSKGNCIRNTQVGYNIVKLIGGPPIQSGSTYIDPSTGHFDINLNPALFTSGVNYTLILTGYCGLDVCTCKINFVFAECPCPCDSVFQDVLQGFFVTGNPQSCKRTFKPQSLCTSDMVSWTVTSPSGAQTIGQTTGNNSIMFNFPGSGYYMVCMNVTRTINGQVCKDTSCRQILVKCISNPQSLCEKNALENGDFTEDIIAGHLGENGQIKGWNLFPNIGNGLVFVSDSAGSLDDGSIILVGNKNNFAGIWQPISLAPNDSIHFAFEIIDFRQGSKSIKTEIVFRLQSDTSLNPLVWVELLRKAMPSGNGSGYMEMSKDINYDAALKYLVICLQNDSDSSMSVIGIDNIEICTSRKPVSTKSENSRLLQIYPNPTNGSLTIELQQPSKSGISFKISDLTGREVFVRKAVTGSSFQTLDLRPLSPGFYFLQIISGGKVLASEKFVKQ